MPNIIQVAEDLKNAPDQWLAQQMQQPSGSAPPWLVASEVARRERLRNGTSKAQAPQSSVSEDLIKSLYARIPPTAGLMPQGGPPTPPGMPPVNLSPGSNPSTLGAGPGSTPPGNFRMPAHMAAGGSVDDNGDDDQPDNNYDIYNMPLQNPSRRAQLDQLMMPPVEQPQAPQEPQVPQPAAAPQAAPVMPTASSSGPVGSASRMMPDTGGRDEITRLVDDAAQRHQLPPELISAVIKRESNFNPQAIGPKTNTGEHALGLMQVMPSTAAGEFGITDPAKLLDPAVNIDTGSAYLAKLLKMFNGDQTKALAAYNMGPTALQRNNGVPYRSTDAYITNINNDMNAQRKQLGLAPVTNIQPSILQSRLLQARQDQQPADDTAVPPASDATAAPVTPTVAATTDVTTSAPPAVTPSDRPIVAPAIERPAELRELDAQFERASKDLAVTLARVVPYDPSTTTTPEAIQGYKNRIRTFIGPEPDNAKFEQSFQELTAMAQQLLHPKMGNMLMQWGMHLMASKQHNFGVAMGEAGLAAQADYEKQQAQGRGLWVQALDLGLKLQDRTNNYNAKLGEMAMQEQRLDQTAGTAQYTQQFNLAKERRVELQEIAKERAKAQGELDKTFAASPAGRLVQINQFRQSIGQPAINTQNASKAEMEYYEFGKKPTGTGSPTETSLAWEAAGSGPDQARAQKALQIMGKGDAGFEAYLNPQGAGGNQVPGTPAIPGQPARLGPVVTPPAAAAPPQAQAPDPSESLVRGTPSLGFSPTPRNEALLANMPPEEAVIIRNLANYKQALPARQALSKPIWQHRMQAAMLYDSNFNQSTYEQRAKTQKDFTGGMEARQVNALNTLIGHAQRLQKNWAALNNWGGWGTMFNAPANWLLKAKGDPRIAPTIMDLQAVPEEMMRLWRAAGGSDKDLAGWKQALNLNMAPAEQRAAITEVLGLAEGKLRGLRNQYENAMGRPADFHFLTPESSQFFQHYGIDHRDIDPGYAVQPGGFGGGGGGAAAAGGGDKVMLGGREIVSRGGRWVYKDSGQAVQ